MISKGKYSYGDPKIICNTNNNNLYIGNFCSIAGNVKVYLGGNHRTDWVSTFPFGHTDDLFFYGSMQEGHPISNGDVSIGNDVWIGENVTIMSGVNIGDGAVIANNSHVVKNVNPYSIIGGNPAKLIRHRFKPTQVDQLLKIKWWDWDDEKIKHFVPLLSNDNIDNFIMNASEI